MAKEEEEDEDEWDEEAKDDMEKSEQSDPKDKENTGDTGKGSGEATVEVKEEIENPDKRPEGVERLFGGKAEEIEEKPEAPIPPKDGEVKGQEVKPSVPVDDGSLVVFRRFEFWSV